MPRIIIVAPSYKETIGGIVVLHRLCDVLIKLGYDAYLYPLGESSAQFKLNENFSYKIYSDYVSFNDIVIYPEIVTGNPLGANNVIRYILNKARPELKKFEYDDLWIYFSEKFYYRERPFNCLNLTYTDLNLFKNYNIERTISECYTFRKYHYYNETLNKIHSNDAIHIPVEISNIDLVSIFNNCETFISYDTETYLSVLAALCGCNSVIVPRPNLSKKDIIDSQRHFTYGISYGMDDIGYSMQTKHLVRDHILNIEKQQIIDCHNLFKNTIIPHFNKV